MTPTIALVGAMVVDAAGGVRLHLHEELQPRQHLAMQFAASDGRIRCCVSVRAASFEPTDRDDSFSDLVSGYATTNYRMKATVAPRNNAAFAGMALGYSRSFRLQHSTPTRITAIVDGKRVSLSLCTSTEGFHVVEGPTGSPSVDLYVPLGYTLESTSCQRQ
jgi:hypothetical protein